LTAGMDGQYDSHGAGTGNCLRTPGPVGAEWTVLQYHWSTACQPGVPLFESLYLLPAESLVDGPIEDYDAAPRPPKGNTATPDVPDPGSDVVRQGLRDALESGENEVLNDWLCAHLGGDCVDPTGQLVRVPACRGDSYQTCRTRLQAAGFTGTITQSTLSAEDAIMEEEADRTTATNPATSTQTKHDADITVYVNPDPMPTMTAMQTLIAETLKASDPNEITDSNKKTIARQCERRATAQGSGRSVSDCLDPSLPTYVVGREHPEAADHTIDALKSYAPWVLLTYANRERPSGWPNNYSETDPGGAPKCLGKYLVTACDEWPWIKTEEGGPKPGPIPPSAHLRIINHGQNSGSGSKYRYFLDACKIRERKALPTPLNGGGRFLVIPVPKGAPTSTPSLNLCHGTNP
ncbi:MAG: hypothetical protein M3313_15685, partial [Actinomycetota bacterium]|nr:hypothetical protein [Actinomycetota bacterium]